MYKNPWWAAPLPPAADAHASGCLFAQYCKFLFCEYRLIYIVLFVRRKLK